MSLCVCVCVCAWWVCVACSGKETGGVQLRVASVARIVCQTRTGAAVPLLSLSALTAPVKLSQVKSSHALITQHSPPSIVRAVGTYQHILRVCRTGRSERSRPSDSPPRTARSPCSLPLASHLFLALSSFYFRLSILCLYLRSN
jgi:hypothetical protein